MTVSDARLAGENAALALRQRLRLSDDGIDLEEVAAQRDVAVFRHGFGENAPDGMYLFDGEDAIIVVNETKPAQRQRFTLAHELGHHELHRRGGPVQLVDLDVYATEAPEGQKDLDEVAANAFAAHLLLPRTAIEQVLGSRRNRQVDVVDLVELIRRHRVSWEMALWRMQNERFIRNADRERLAAMPRRATLAPHGIDEMHYALRGRTVPISLALDAARLWSHWHLSDDRLAQILELPVRDALTLMDEWDLQRDDRRQKAADAGEAALAEAGIDLAEIAAAIPLLDDDENEE